MSNIQPLIDYLKINRRVREEQAKDLDKMLEVVNQDYDVNTISLDNPHISVLKTDFKKYYRELSKVISINIDDAIYIEVLDTLNNPESLQYYVQRVFNESSGEVTKYRKFNDITWSVVDDSDFIEQPLLHHNSVYYYSSNSNRVVINNFLDDVFVFTDEFNYNPEDISEISNGTYELEYQDHEGYDNSFWDQELKALLDGPFKSKIDGLNRKVKVNISQAKGIVNLFPVIELKNGFTLSYKYPDHVFKIAGIRILNSAISINFRYFGAMLEFLNQTVFSELDFDSLEGHSKKRQYFFDSYSSIVNSELRSKRYNIEKVLEILYYTPKVFIEHININDLWDYLETALEQNLTNIGLNEEDVVLRLLKAIYEKSKTSYIFLTELLVRRTNKKETILSILIYRLDGDNFQKLISFLWNVWKTSSYLEIDPEKNSLITENSPVFIDYRSDKTLGFHTDNASIKWDDKDEIINTTVVLNTGEYETVSVRSFGATENKLREKKITHRYKHHPFAPIIIQNSENPSFIFKDDSQEQQMLTILPAFVLYAREESAFWQNVITAGEYLLDIVTTFSGVGNILKVGRLAKILKAGHSLIGKTKTVTKVIQGVKAVAGVVEVTSGVGNTLIKLSGNSDTPFGRAVTKYLFYLEMLSLSGELSVALHAALKKSAKEVLEFSDDLNKVRKAAKNAENTKYIDDTIEHLEEVAEFESRRIIKKFPLGGEFEVLSKNLLKKYINDLTKLLGKKGYTLEVNWINKSHPEYLSKLLGRTKVPVRGKKVILQIREECPKIVWYHESYHFNDLLNLGQKEYIRIARETPWKHEYSVWKKVLDNRNKWRNEELIDAYFYVKNYFKRKDQPFIENTEMERLGKELKLIN